MSTDAPRTEDGLRLSVAWRDKFPERHAAAELRRYNARMDMVTEHRAEYDEQVAIIRNASPKLLRSAIHNRAWRTIRDRYPDEWRKRLAAAKSEVQR